MAFQSLYRRYRPAKFAEIVGQEHTVLALQNAVVHNRVGHAYLFSGPRGTGKTSMARILAKALNCENPKDGEPCGECKSCVQFQANTSYDIYELDAASNNGVESMRELISIVALAPIGKYKIYVIDEVHMLSTGAENALLKTLEEPPPNVIFVMCTTEPHRVVETVRSRAQHLEFGLIEREILEKHIKWIIKDAELTISDADLDYALNAGGGSARDSLSALDQVVAAGSAPKRQELAGDLVAAIVASDTKNALSAVEECVSSGGDLRLMVRQSVDSFRNAFLQSCGVSQERLSQELVEKAKAIADEISLARIVGIIETLGESLGMMRSSYAPRVDLEVALIGLTRVNEDQIYKDLAELQKLLEKVSTAKTQQQKMAEAKPEEKPEAKPEEEPKTEPKVKPKEKPPDLGSKPTIGGVRNKKTGTDN